MPRRPSASLRAVSRSQNSPSGVGDPSAGRSTRRPQAAPAASPEERKAERLDGAGLETRVRVGEDEDVRAGRRDEIVQHRGLSPPHRKLDHAHRRAAARRRSAPPPRSRRASRRIRSARRTPPRPAGPADCVPVRRSPPARRRRRREHRPRAWAPARGPARRGRGPPVPVPPSAAGARGTPGKTTRRARRRRRRARARRRSRSGPREESPREFRADRSPVVSPLDPPARGGGHRSPAFRIREQPNERVGKGRRIVPQDDLRFRLELQALGADRRRNDGHAARRGLEDLQARSPARTQRDDRRVCPSTSRGACRPPPRERSTRERSA